MSNSLEQQPPWGWQRCLLATSALLVWAAEAAAQQPALRPHGDGTDRLTIESRNVGSVVEGRTSRLGTWVWHESDVLDLERRKALMSFVDAQGVNTLYVHVAKQYEQPSGFDALAQLLEEARRLGVSVVWTAGDPRWAEDAHHQEPLRVLERSRRINERLARLGLPRVRAVAFDIEPYLLPSWTKDRHGATDSYLRVLDRIRSEAHAWGLIVYHTLPFWFTNKARQGKPLDALVMSRSDGVIIMGYRRTPAAVIDVASRSLERGGTCNVPVIVAIETKCEEPQHTTFCGVSPSELDEALLELERHLRRFSAFEGLAIHHYQSWRDVKDAVHAPEIP